MGKKMRLPFLLKHSNVKSSSWSWPSCNQPRTLSFRNESEIFKTINSAYIDATVDLLETPDQSFFTNSSTDSTSFSTASEGYSRRVEDPMEILIRGLRSERLFFEPAETSSLLQSKAASEGLPFEESVVLSMESNDPFIDFRSSMQEMVEAHGINDWEGLEELLSWYLRVNVKSNHGYIVGAFVDLLNGLATSGSCSSDSPASPLSFYTSSSFSSFSTHSVSYLEAEEELYCTPSSSSPTFRS